jgi:hypothetical protein
LLLLRRETISQLIGEWSKQQILSLSRGSIAIKNRDGLLGEACGCYAEIKEFERTELALWRGIPWATPRLDKYD